MTDPEIKQILQTPEVMNALNDLQNNPAAIQNIMQNPSLAAKIEKLIQAGVIGTAWYIWAPCLRFIISSINSLLLIILIIFITII